MKRSDWREGGATVEDAVVFAERLKALGVDYVCVSSGGIDPAAKIAVGPGVLRLSPRTRLKESQWRHTAR